VTADLDRPALRRRRSYPRAFERLWWAYSRLASYEKLGSKRLAFDYWQRGRKAGVVPETTVLVALLQVEPGVVDHPRGGTMLVSTWIRGCYWWEHLTTAPQADRERKEST